MKLNVNTTNLQDTLSQLGNETWSLYCLAGLGKDAAFNDVTDVGTLAHLFEMLEQRIDAVHNSLDELNCKYAPTTPKDTDAQALLNLLLVMLKDWRTLISAEGNKLDSRAFEICLEQAVSLASSVVEVRHV